jgi:hypothetical protein
MFLFLYQTADSSGDPFWLIWMVTCYLSMLTVLYGKGVLLVVYQDRYYGATDSKAFTDVTDLYFPHQD